MKKKIAISTFHSAHNYGAVLQTYALYKTLENMGCEVYLLDYSPQKIIKSYTLLPRACDYGDIISYSKSWVSLLLDFKRRYNRYKRFNLFLKKHFTSFPDNETEIDFIVVGSDQIWNPEITDGLDENYFGIHKNIKAIKVFSYAASMGILSLDQKDEKKFISLLSNISNIGVREEALALYIKALTGKDAIINVDPTLLLNRNEWQMGMKNKIVERKKYLLIYEVKEHLQTSKIAKEIANELDLDIITLTAKTSYKIGSDCLTDSSPEDFLSLFEGADFIITTSFHGTVFSIINQKNFFTLAFGNDIDLRAKNLLSQVGLTERLIKNSSDYDMSNLDVDYMKNKTFDRLGKIREQSIEYIRNSIK